MTMVFTSATKTCGNMTRPTMSGRKKQTLVVLESGRLPRDSPLAQKGIWGQEFQKQLRSAISGNTTHSMTHGHKKQTLVAQPEVLLPDIQSEKRIHWTGLAAGDIHLKDFWEYDPGSSNIEIYNITGSRMGYVENVSVNGLQTFIKNMQDPATGMYTIVFRNRDRSVKKVTSRFIVTK